MADGKVEDVVSIWTVRRKSEPDPKGYVTVLLTPEEPDGDPDHPNADLWRDPYRIPTGSINRVVRQDVAEKWAVGDRIEIVENEIEARE